jgi:CubicO group peptidase (beta-lactamase class C family)
MNMRPSTLRVSLALLLLAHTALAQVPIARPEAVSMSSARLAQMDAVIADAIADKKLPGAVVLVGREGRIVWRKAYGARAVEPVREAMTPDTIFDLASLTKIVATATSVMILMERGKLRLSDPVSVYIPELKGEGRDRITIEQLLTHVSGYAPDFDLRERWTGYDEAIKRLIKEPLRNPPGTRFTTATSVSSRSAKWSRAWRHAARSVCAEEHLWTTAHANTAFVRARVEARIAPTEKRRGQMSYLGDTASNAARKASVAARRGPRSDFVSHERRRRTRGLFSTANDLAIYCQMILNGGTYRGVRILSPLTVAEMTRPRVVASNGATRGLGWDINTTFSSNRGDLFPLGSFGHTGFTGTSLWIDPASQMFVVFLSNRVHPDGKGDVGPLRGRVATIVGGVDN